ncbi:Dirigent protein [Dillenia turbinata]|uniref:Dirigent protein n=1 Tax=Dillenia turbinata TaxID=194707 RepID=A0AAN8UVJ3_9MAGN
MVGRAHGLAALDGVSELNLRMTMDLAFTDGKYNGSTLNLAGGNHIAQHVRGIPITGRTAVVPQAQGQISCRTSRLARAQEYRGLAQFYPDHFCDKTHVEALV